MSIPFDRIKALAKDIFLKEVRLKDPDRFGEDSASYRRLAKAALVAAAEFEGAAARVEKVLNK